jgi:hypothetical protein
MTICSEQYILDKTIFDMMRYFFPISSSTSFLAWNLTIFRMRLPDDLQLKYQQREVLYEKNPAKFAQKLYTQKPLFWLTAKFSSFRGQ